METFGRYQLQDRLGQGGMGVVYRAFDTTLERTVALKLLLPAEADAELRKRLFREARSAGNLRHRNVVTIYDLGEHDGRPYLAMELLEGEDLQRRLSRPEKMSLRHKVDLSIEICEGLAHAHAHGVVHRDIKPANIFITNEGAAKLLDFGLARLMSSQLTRSNMLMGTLNYMAPEQVRGERADHRSDIFSTGVVLYELFGGRKAFEGDSVASTLYKILQEVPEPLSKVDATLPNELASIIECMLAKLPDERYPTMDAVCRDLEMYRATYRVGAVTPVPSPIPPISEPVPPRPAPGSPTTNAPPDARATAPVPPRRRWSVAAIAAVAIVAVAVPVIWMLAGRSSPSAPVPPSPAPTQQRVQAPQTPARESQTVDPQRGQTEAGNPAVSDAAPRGPRTGAREAAPPAAASASSAAPSAAPTNTRARNAAPARSTTGGAGTPAPQSATPQPSVHVPPPEPAPAAPPSPPAPSPNTASGHTERPPSAADVAPAVPAAASPPPAALGTASPPPQPVPASPASTAAPAPAPETTSGAVAEQRVTELLGHYKQALEAKSIDQMKRIWPSLGANEEAAIRQEFQHASRIVVTIDRPEIVVSGSAGRVTFTRNYSLVTVDGQRLRSTTSAVMDVRRSGNTWVIDSIRFAER